jgi:site-specific recombinase XerC
MTILNAAQEAASMGHRKKSNKRLRAKTILRLPDLEQSKNAVLNSLAAASSQESYGHAIDEFIGWYCSEPRLAFNRSVVLRYRFFLEQKNLAPSTINVRLAAVRRLAHEAADTGLLSSELAVGIGRVKGAKRLGTRIGNWLTVEQSRTLLAEPRGDSLRGKRDRAILALLIGCGLRRAELVGLGLEDFQIREEHWVIADLVGKGKHIRTVPVPAWAKRVIDDWTDSARAQALHRKLSGTSLKRLRNVCTSRISLRTTYVAPAHGSATWPAENSNRFSSCSDMHPFRRPSITWDANRNCDKR